MKRKLACAALWLFCVSGASAESEADIIKGDVLRKTLSGRTIFIRTPLGELPVKYSANGTMSASCPPHLASMAGESVASDTGQWWIAGDKLCQRWQNWLKKQTYCYEMRGSEGSITWRRSDGETGRARMGS
ncbi:MAG: hypothetical protein NW215_11315 [Hyphomicrobiales bacterium]|nr:hypothetical protein [Hyphomicrobiales bacterium]